MKNLRKLGTAVVLTFVLGLFAFAGERATSACGPEPGQVDTPPCAMAQAPTTGEMGTPTVASDDASLTEIASSVLRSILLLF